MQQSVTITHIVMPGQTNRHGSLFGGVALSLMDEAAAIVAHRVSNGPVVTAHIADVSFKAPIWQGWAVEVTATLRRRGRTSLRIDVETYGECLDTGERLHCTTAEFVMVAVDQAGRPRELPELIREPQEDDDGDDS